MLDDLADLAVTLDGDGDDAAGARGDLLNVAKGRRLNLEDFSVVRLGHTAPVPIVRLFSIAWRPARLKSAPHICG